MKAPVLPAVLAAGEAWLSSVPDEDRLRTIDHLYLEQRLGCWASPTLLSGTGPRPTRYPLNRRDVVDAFLSPPVTDKLNGTIIEAVIRQGWPELLEVPFNEPVGWHRFRRNVTRMVENPRPVLGAIRRRLMPS